MPWRYGTVLVGDLNQMGLGSPSSTSHCKYLCPLATASSCHELCSARQTADASSAVMAPSDKCIHGGYAMKKLLLLGLLVAISISPAFAQWHRGGGWWGYDGGLGGRSGWLFPALITGAIVYDVTRPPPVYVQPVPVYAPVYVQSPTPEAAAPAGQFWYFCAGSNGYYPYVHECPSGWQAVPSTPPAVAVR